MSLSLYHACIAKGTRTLSSPVPLLRMSIIGRVFRRQGAAVTHLLPSLKFPFQLATSVQLASPLISKNGPHFLWTLPCSEHQLFDFWCSTRRWPRVSPRVHLRSDAPNGRFRVPHHWRPHAGICWLSVPLGPISLYLFHVLSQVLNSKCKSM